MTRLDVVKRVAIPANSVAKAIGRSIFVGSAFIRRMAIMAEGISTAAAAMLFIKSERKAALKVNANKNPFSLRPDTRSKNALSRSPSPVSWMALEMTNADRSRITAELLNPPKASCCVMIPRALSEMSTSNATRSGRSQPLMNKNVATIKMARVRAIPGMTIPPKGKLKSTFLVNYSGSVKMALPLWHGLKTLSGKRMEAASTRNF